MSNEMEFNGVTPNLPYEDAAETLDWLERVCGFMGRARILLLPTLLLALTSCSSSSLEGAGKGALGGAAAGAVGGMISAAIFGGDVGNAAARGAAWGASVGAVSGAVQGASADAAREQQATSQERQEQARISAQVAEIRRQLGDDAYTSLERLVDGKYDAALAYARSAQKSPNQEHALAGLWLEAVTYYDAGAESEAEARIPGLLAAEPTLSTEADTRVILVDLHEGLLEIREAFGITI